MADELAETVELYRAAAKERDALIAAVRDIVWINANGQVCNRYQDFVDLSQKHPILRCVLEG